MIDFNSVIGEINPVTFTFECDTCEDSGLVTATESDISDGIKVFTTYDWTEDKDKLFKECQCAITKKFKLMMLRSGLDDVIDLRIGDYKIKHKWQKEIKEKLIKFAKQPTRSFLVSGQTGSGKTMAMNILFKNLVGKYGRQGHYLEWETFMTQSNNNYREIDLKDYDYISKIPILYIDDFLKCPNNDTSSIGTNEVRFARNVINQRYKNDKLITLISTELTEKQLESIDGSLHGRIVEMCTLEYFVEISKGADKNIRIEIAKGDF